MKTTELIIACTLFAVDVAWDSEHLSLVQTHIPLKVNQNKSKN